MKYCNHPPLKVGDFWIYGGPLAKARFGFDVYVGFDKMVEYVKTIDQAAKSGAKVIYFPIPNMGTPDPVKFDHLINWLCNQLQANKSIYLGCIGGHGRTGMALVALVARMTGNADAISYVRDNYCAKAVESDRQVEFLKRYYKVTPQKPVMLSRWGLTKPKDTL